MTILLLILPLTALILFLVATARVWRSSPMLAIGMFLFTPVGLYVLVRYWSDDSERVKLPLLGAYATLALWIVAAYSIVSSAPLQQRIVAGEDASSDEAEAPPVGDDIADRVRRRVAIANLPMQGGLVDIPPAKAAIDVPLHFRFIERGALAKAFAGSDDEPEESLMGWLVHESVDLTGAQAWHVDVHRLGDGFVSDESFAIQSRETLLAASQRGMKKYAETQDASEPEVRLVDFAEAPRFDAAAHSVTWVQELAIAGKPRHVLDCYSIKLGRLGAMLYSISEVPTSQRELCLRTVRLIAGRTRFENGQTYADRSRLLDRKASYDLVALVTGNVANEKP